MKTIKTTIGRRSFIKRSTLAGGGIMLSFNWLTSCDMTPNQVKALPKEWFKINGFLKIGENGLVTIMSPNPEIGQNVKTSMPMLVAEELDVNWDDVIVEQAPLNTSVFTRQLAGGSQSIRQGWNSLRMAGATARAMLIQAAAKTWEVDASEITTIEGQLIHEATGKKSGYGPMASLASEMEIPEEVPLKEIADFKIIGTSRNNVDGQKIVTGQPLYGLDYSTDNMLIAMVVHPPAFGMQLKSVDDSQAASMPGIRKVFRIKPPSDLNISTFLETNKLDLELKLEVQYMYLENDEKRRLVENEQSYLIEEYYENDSMTNVIDSKSQNYYLNYPVKELIIVSQRNDMKHINNWNNYSNWVIEDVPPFSEQYSSSEHMYYSTNVNSNYLSYNNGVAPLFWACLSRYLLRFYWLLFCQIFWLEVSYFADMTKYFEPRILKVWVWF